MTVTAKIPRNVTIAAPGAKDFAFDFKIISKGDLQVQINGVTKTVDIDYTVSGVGADNGGNIEFIAPLAGGETVVRKNNMPYERLTDYQNLGDLRSSTLNNDQDAPILMIQQILANAMMAMEDNDGRMDARGRILSNLLPGLLDTDAVTLGQVVDLIESAIVPDAGQGANLLRQDLSSSANNRGTSLLSHRGQVLQTLLDDIIKQAEFGLGQAGINTSNALNYALEFLNSKGTDNRGETYANGLRRSVQLRRVTGSSVEERPELSDDADVTYSGRLNSTAAGFYLLALATYAEKIPNRAGAVRPFLQEAADWLLGLQWNTPGVARYGGMKLAPDSGQTSCFGTAVCGRALLKAYGVTKNASYLTAARLCADYLLVLKEPNATYLALYGETPIPAYTANGRTFTGFCDGISAADTITITSQGWNAYACIFLKEIGDLLANATYQNASSAAFPFYATIVQYAFDYFAIQNAAPSAHVSVRFTNDGTLNFADHDWHRIGEYTISGAAVNSGTLTGATATTVTLPGTASAVNDAYKDMIIRLTGGTGADGDTNERRKITAYNGTTKVATLDRAYTIVPDATTTYQIGIYPNTMGTDQWEYAFEALYFCGYNPNQLLTWYTTWTSLPNATLDSFGSAYEGGRCLTGYIRVASPVYGGLSKAYGSYYDSVGAAILLPFKKAMVPADYAKARNMCLVMPQRGALLDENMLTIYSAPDVNGIERATKGTLPVAEAMIALIETLDI